MRSRVARRSKRRKAVLSFLKVVTGRGEGEAVAFVASWLWFLAKSQVHWWDTFETRVTLRSLAAELHLSPSTLSRALRRGARAGLWSYESDWSGVVIRCDGGGLRRRYLARMKSGHEGVLVPVRRTARFLLHHRIDHCPAPWIRQPVGRLAHWLACSRSTLRRRISVRRGVAKLTAADTHHYYGSPEPASETLRETAPQSSRSQETRAPPLETRLVNDLFKSSTGTGLRSMKETLRTPTSHLKAEQAVAAEHALAAATPAEMIEAIGWIPHAPNTRKRFIRELAKLIGLGRVGDWIRKHAAEAVAQNARPAGAHFHYALLQELRNRPGQIAPRGREEGPHPPASRAQSQAPPLRPPPSLSAAEPGHPAPQSTATPNTVDRMQPGARIDRAACTAPMPPDGMPSELAERWIELAKQGRDPAGWRRHMLVKTWREKGGRDHPGPILPPRAREAGAGSHR